MSLADRVFKLRRQTGRGGIVLSDELDADQISQGLWMGSHPPTGRAVADSGFDLLVLCAEEYQPSARLFPGVEVIHAPFDDNSHLGPLPHERKIARHAAEQVALALRQSKNVLSTCWAGLNRSGLVSGLALTEIGHDPVQTIHLIQGRRNGALSNQHFVDLIAGS